MGPTPVYGARANKNLQNADFAMKQTNIRRLSGDINSLQSSIDGELLASKVHRYFDHRSSWQIAQPLGNQHAVTVILTAENRAIGQYSQNIIMTVTHLPLNNNV